MKWLVCIALLVGSCLQVAAIGSVAAQSYKELDRVRLDALSKTERAYQTYQSYKERYDRHLKKRDKLLEKEQTLRDQDRKAQDSLTKLQNELAVLIAEKEQALEELRLGYYCSQCGRPKSQVERETKKSFGEHLNDVNGVAKPATSEQIQNKADEYDRKIQTLREKIQKLSEKAEVDSQKRWDSYRKEIVRYNDELREIADKLRQSSREYGKNKALYITKTKEADSKFDQSLQARIDLRVAKYGASFRKAKNAEFVRRTNALTGFKIQKIDEGVFMNTMDALVDWFQGYDSNNMTVEDMVNQGKAYASLGQTGAVMGIGKEAADSVADVNPKHPLSRVWKISTSAGGLANEFSNRERLGSASEYLKLVDAIEGDQLFQGNLGAAGDLVSAFNNANKGEPGKAFLDLVKATSAAAKYADVKTGADIVSHGVNISDHMEDFKQGSELKDQLDDALQKHNAKHGVDDLDTLYNDVKAWEYEYQTRMDPQLELNVPQMEQAARAKARQSEAERAAKVRISSPTYSPRPLVAPNLYPIAWENYYAKIRLLKENKQKMYEQTFDGQIDAAKKTLESSVESVATSISAFFSSSYQNDGGAL